MNKTTQSWWFVFYKDQLLLEKKENGTFALPYGEIPPITIKEKTTVHTITTLEERLVSLSPSPRLLKNRHSM